MWPTRRIGSVPDVHPKNGHGRFDGCDVSARSHTVPPVLGERHVLRASEQGPGRGTGGPLGCGTLRRALETHGTNAKLETERSFVLESYTATHV